MDVTFQGIWEDQRGPCQARPGFAPVPLQGAPPPNPPTTSGPAHNPPTHPAPPLTNPGPRQHFDSAWLSQVQRRASGNGGMALCRKFSNFSGTTPPVPPAVVGPPRRWVLARAAARLSVGLEFPVFPG